MHTHALPSCPRRGPQKPSAGTSGARTRMPIHTVKTEPQMPRAAPDRSPHPGPGRARLLRPRKAARRRPVSPATPPAPVPGSRQRAGGLFPTIFTAGSSPPALQLHANNNFQRKKAQQMCYLRSHPSSRGKKKKIPKLPPHLHLLSFSLCLRLNCGPALGLCPCSERPFPSTQVLLNSPRSRRLN